MASKIFPPRQAILSVRIPVRITPKIYHFATPNKEDIMRRAETAAAGRLEGVVVGRHADNRFAQRGPHLPRVPPDRADGRRPRKARDRDLAGGLRRGGALMDRRRVACGAVPPPGSQGRGESDRRRPSEGLRPGRPEVGLAVNALVTTPQIRS